MTTARKSGKKIRKAAPSVSEFKEAVSQNPAEEIEEVKKALFEEKKNGENQVLPSAGGRSQEKPSSGEGQGNHEEDIPVVQDVRVEAAPSSVIKNILPAAAGFVVGVFAALSFIFFYGEKIKIEQLKTAFPSATTSPASTTAPQISPSVSPVIDFSLYDITVLNGSGRAGEAGKLEKKLRSEGFSVLETGNADKSNYKKTVLKTKTRVPGIFLEKLTNFLKTQFELEEKIENLADSEKTDVVIIVGSAQVAQSTPSATITTSGTVLR